MTIAVEEKVMIEIERNKWEPWFEGESEEEVLAMELGFEVVEGN